jgi:hypothetical protein
VEERRKERAGGEQESQPPHLQRLIRHQQFWDDKRFTGHSNALFVCSIMAKWRLPWISWPPSHSLWLRPYLKRRTIWPPGSTDQADTLHLESVRFEVACLGRIDSSWWVQESCTEGGSRPAYNMQAPVELAILEDDSKAKQMSFGLHLYTAFLDAFYTITGRHHFRYEFEGGINIRSRRFRVIRPDLEYQRVLLYYSGPRNDSAYPRIVQGRECFCQMGERKSISQFRPFSTLVIELPGLVIGFVGYCCSKRVWSCSCHMQLHSPRRIARSFPQAPLTLDAAPQPTEPQATQFLAGNLRSRFPLPSRTGCKWNVEWIITCDFLCGIDFDRFSVSVRKAHI